MTRATYRFRDYTIRPDLRPDAEPITSTMQCRTCCQGGPQSEDFEDATTWAVSHLRANPEHLDFREVITRPHRFEAGVWN